MRWLVLPAVLLAATLVGGASRPARAQDPGEAMDARREAIERWHESRRAWLEARRQGLLDMDPVEQPGIRAGTRPVTSSHPRSGGAAGIRSSRARPPAADESVDYAPAGYGYAAPYAGSYFDPGSPGGYGYAPPYADDYFDTPACVALRRAPGQDPDWTLPAVPGFALEARCGLPMAGYGAGSGWGAGSGYGVGGGWGAGSGWGADGGWGPGSAGYPSSPWGGYGSAGYGYGFEPGGYGAGAAPYGGYGYGAGGAPMGGNAMPGRGVGPDGSNRGGDRRDRRSEMPLPHRFYQRFHPDDAAYPWYGGPSGWGRPWEMSDCALVRVSTPEGAVTLRVRPGMYGVAGPTALGAILRQRLVAGAGLIVRSESGMELRVPPWTPVGELRVLDCGVVR